MTEEELQDYRRARLVHFVDVLNGGPSAVMSKFKLTRSWGSQYAQIKGGSSFASRAARNMEAKLDMPSMYLDKLDVSAGTPVSAIGDEDHLPDEYVQIRESEVKFAAGNGRTPLFDEITSSVPRTYRRSWFVDEGINPDNARCFKVDGDSMEELLYHGDTVLVNLAETNIINGKVYALRYGDELKIKRVYRKIDGGLVLHSDNPLFIPRDEEIPADVVTQHIGIIGRVRDKSGKGGL